MRRRANIPIFVPHAGCPHACSFCNQRAVTGLKAAVPSPEEAAALCRSALQGMRGRFEKVEIAFFGGSFTAIPRERMIGLLEAVMPFVTSGQAEGIRISTRPDAVDGEVLSLLRAYGVTAIELGVQSMDARVLRGNGRGHSPEDTVAASRLIRARGFELGHQMMTGLYGDTHRGAVDTAGRIIALGPDTVRVYPTLVLEGTALAGLWRRGEYRPPSLEESVDLCAGLLGMFEKAGIRVIRMGLHASRDMERQLLAGAYHPAFRELCEGRLMLRDMERLLAGKPAGPALFRVARGAVSKAVGQRRRNLEALARQGYEVTIKESMRLKGHEIELDLNRGAL